MQEQVKPLEELVKELPSDYQEEVRDFVLFLLQKRATRTRRKLKVDWSGGSKDTRDQYTSADSPQTPSEKRVPALSPKKQRRLHLLLDYANAGKLTTQQNQELEQLIEEAQLLTIRKARLLADALGK